MQKSPSEQLCALGGRVNATKAVTPITRCQGNYLLAGPSSPVLVAVDLEDMIGVRVKKRQASFRL